jgi:Secretion system C-terminal sorting domain
MFIEKIPIANELTDKLDCIPIYYDPIVPDQKANIIPNPAQDYIDISTFFDNNIVTVLEIVDMTGKIVLVSNIKPNTIGQRIDIQHLLPGAYTTIIKSNNKILYNEKLIIAR